MNDTTKKRPTHTIYKVMGEGPNADWIKVGVGFPHKDGRGIFLVFDGIPVQGRIAVRLNKPRVATPSVKESFSQPSLQM